MDSHCVGVPGDLSDEQRAALHAADIQPDVAQVRVGIGIPVEWKTSWTLVRLVADDEGAAVARVAEVLNIEARRMQAYSPRFFEPAP
jgi:hypothetical protein